MSVQETYAKLIRVHTRLLKLEREKVRLTTEYTEAKAEFKQAIERGETTGDRLYDMVVSAHGLHSPLLEKYQALAQAIKGMSGELVLHVFVDEVRTRHVFGRGWETEARTCFRLGILDSDELVLGHGRTRGCNDIDLPINRFIDGSMQRVGTQPGLERYKVHTMSMFDTYHDPSPDLLETLLGKVNWRPLLTVGDEAVRKRLATEYSIDVDFDEAAEALGRLILKPTE